MRLRCCTSRGGERVPQRERAVTVPAVAHTLPTAVAAISDECPLAAPRPMIALQVRLPNGVQLDLGERTLKELPSLGADAEPTAMFRFDKGLKVYLHREPVDFPLNINGLAELVG